MSGMEKLTQVACVGGSEQEVAFAVRAAGEEGKSQLMCDHAGHAKEPDFILEAMGSQWKLLSRRQK